MLECNKIITLVQLVYLITTRALSLKLWICQVSATRRGLKNQLKNLWWRKGKEETSDVQAAGQ